MLSPSHFLPGSILWLPLQKDIPGFDTHHAHNTVPKKCFNHPVLVLSEDKANKYVTLLILTSFHNSHNIPARVQKRGHELRQYVPIHPAPQLVIGPPSLRLADSQENSRHVWANIQPYRCPSAWLQATWSNIWKGNRRGGRVESASLRALVMYGIQEGSNPEVYRKVLESHVERVATPEVTTPYSRLGAVRVDALQSSRTTPMPSNSSRSGVVFSTVPRLEAGLVRNYSWSARPGEREPLLPRTHRSAPRNSRVYPTAGGYGASPKGRGSFVVAWVLCFLVVLVFVVSVGGVLWVGYVAVGSLVTAFRDAVNTVAAFVGPLKGRIVVFATETGKAVRDIGTQLRDFCKGLLDWVREV